MTDRLVSLGPCAVPVVSIKKFSRLSVPRHGMLKEVWRLIGPTVEANITRLPMWEVIAIAYIEGLNHGAGIAREEIEEEKQMAAEDSKYFIPRSSLGKGFDYLYDVQELLIDGGWRLVLQTNDRQEAISRASGIKAAGGVPRIVDNSR